MASLLAVYTLDGSSHGIYASSSCQVRDVKLGICAKTGIPTCEQILLNGSQMLVEKEPVSPVVSSGGHLTLVRRPPEDAAWLERFQQKRFQDWGTMPEHLFHDREVVLSAVASTPWLLCKLDACMKADRTVVLEAVQNDPSILEQVPAPLKRDREVVLAAVTRCADALQAADISMKADRAIMVAAISQKPELLAEATKELKDDREVVLAAVRKMPKAILHASESLRNDRGVVAVAVARSPELLSCAPAWLQADFLANGPLTCEGVSRIPSDRDCARIVRRAGRRCLFVRG